MKGCKNIECIYKERKKKQNIHIFLLPFLIKPVLVLHVVRGSLNNPTIFKYKRKTRDAPPVLLVMSFSVHACSRTCNEHVILLIIALTVHLFVSVTAPWWLLLSPSRGGEDEVELGSPGRKRSVSRSLIPRRITGGKRKATRRTVSLEMLLLRYVGLRRFTMIEMPPTHSVIKHARHLTKRKETG